MINFFKLCSFFKKKRIKKHSFTKECFKNSRFIIGEYTYGEPQIFDWHDNSNLIIGKFCSIASGVKIFLGGNHNTKWNTTYPIHRLLLGIRKIEGYPLTKGDVIIGNDVWIGNGATILSGVRIGNGSCIAAMAVVSKDVPPYAIVAGNPAKIVKFRFCDERIKILEELSWWDWPIKKILKNYKLLESEQILSSHEDC